MNTPDTTPQTAPETAPDPAQSLARQFAHRGLAAYFAAARPFLRPAIALDLHGADDTQLAIGQSKMGGLPDLPADMAWPHDGSTPMALIAQINLAELQAAAPTDALPERGMLWVFYETERGDWGYDPAHASGFAVVYADVGPHALQRRTAPDKLPEGADFSAAALRFSSTANVPDYPSNLFDYEMSAEEDDHYWEWRDETGDTPINKMLGHSDNVQNPQELQCQLVTHGLYCGDSSGYEDPRRAELEPGAADWQLLMQIDSNEDECAMMWGDSGRLYVWIRQEDLQARRFEKCWVILQCY